ncbi:MAG TPA: UDP-N-acetylmuramoyl-tripeptide--D-alanyl-D-alanine ligase [Ignavibacteriaceae bacterium]|nr:UDP-N-acetylmuramoyl-tripeptide--D-alanyl-D-alanine ligase [Ignavibacteriaceae bacterium]
MSKVKINIEDIFEIPTAEIFNPDGFNVINAISIDSRNIPPRAIFVAIKGKKFDGHNFIDDAVTNGAEVIMINKNQLNKTEHLDLPIVAVKNTTIALGDLARIWRSKLQTKIIGITGSAGKTSTKEILAALLSSKYKVNKTLANNNNHIGVPLTLFSTNNNHDVLVLELGTNHFGEIPYTASIGLPDYGIITNIGDSHLEFFESRNGVYKEKIELFKAIDSIGGIVFVNNDDKLLSKATKFKNVITYGFNSDSDVKGKILSYDEEGKPNIEIKYRNINYNFTLPLAGEQNAKNFLAAAAVVLKIDLSREEIEKGLKQLTAYDKRLNIKKFKNVIVIDDTYNANPESMRSSIELLGKIQTKEKKIAVLGDMFELGVNGKELHQNLSKVIKKNKIDSVYTIGSLMKNLYEILKNSKIETRHFISRSSLNRFLAEKDFSNNAVLVKGSRGMKMEEFVKVLEDRLK